MFITAVNLLQEVIYHHCIIVVSPLYHGCIIVVSSFYHRYIMVVSSFYHRCITVVSGWVPTKHCSQRTKGGGGGGGHPVGYNADDE